ncbi:hypothetical protein [Streptomyces chartreusis]
MAHQQAAFFTGESGAAQQAVHLFDHIVASARTLLDEAHPDVLDARHQLAYFTGESGNTHAAAHQFRALLNDREPHRPNDHQQIIATQRSCIWFATRPDTLAESEHAMHALLDEATALIGADALHTLAIRSSLATLARAGRHSEALERFAALIEDRIRLLEPEHPHILRSRLDWVHALAGTLPGPAPRSCAPCTPPKVFSKRITVTCATPGLSSSSSLEDPSRAELCRIGTPGRNQVGGGGLELGGPAWCGVLACAAPRRRPRSRSVQRRCTLPDTRDLPVAVACTRCAHKAGAFRDAATRRGSTGAGRAGSLALRRFAYVSPRPAADRQVTCRAASTVGAGPVSLHSLPAMPSTHGRPFRGRQFRLRPVQVGGFVDAVATSPQGRRRADRGGR